jgi:hypothetical protein
MVIIIPKGILLPVALNNSEILIFISISINKNNIDTAPTYTNKYDIPMKFTPNNIKYIATLENKNIKHSTDTIGFLLIIINIPKTIEIKDNMSKNSYVKPLV